MKLGKRILSILSLSLLIGVATHPLVSACAPEAQTCSSDYQVNESFFGSGGALYDCSTSYCTKQSAGELTVGNTSSADYQAQAGFNTDRTPFLQFIVNSGTTNIGTLSTGSTTTTTATFTVKNYLSGGYSVVTVALPPQNNTYNMHALSTPTASSVGTEQFGMNLATNTTGCGAPANFGLAPQQVPGPTYSFGVAASGYNTCGLFKYVNGDTIASSATSSGETDYTISYIYNISVLTPGGAYTFNDVLVATATF